MVFCLSLSALNKYNNYFEENKGQILNADGEKITDVFMQVNLPGACVWITKNGIVYNFYKINSGGKFNPETNQHFNNDTINWYRTLMTLKGATISTDNLKKTKKASFKNIYFRNSSNQIESELFEEIIFNNIYSGIDWKLYFVNGKIKQEFIVQPGANTELIQFEYKTTNSLTVKNNKLIISNPLGIFTEGNLYCYQSSQTNEIASRYQYSEKTDFQLTNNIKIYNIKLKINAYNHSVPLIIDPILDWSTYFGGSNDEDGNTIFNDGNFTWVSGHTLSFNFPTANPGSPAYFQGSNAGGFGDLFISKFNNAGNLIWTSYFGGSSNDETETIYSDGNSLWVGGYTGSSNFPVFNPGNGAFFSGNNGGGADGFILKFDVNGTLLWGTYCGGINNDNVSSLHVNNNELFIGGTSNSPNFPVLNAGSFFQNYNNGNDGFIMKFNALNNLSWSTFIGGSNNDLITGIRTGGNNFYVSGYTNSTNFVTLNNGGFFQNNLSGSYDAFISKFSLSGSLLWSTYYGGANHDKINSLTINNNTLWLAGSTTSTNLPLFNLSSSSFNQTNNNGFTDSFITKINQNDNMVWSTYFGGNNADYLTSIISDGDNIFIGGYSNSTNLFTLNPGNGAYFQGNNAGFYDGILLKFDTSSTCLWSSYLGSSSNDYVYGLHCNSSKIYAVGYTQSLGYPTLNPGSNAYFQSSNGGGMDCYITTFKNCIQPVVNPALTNLPCNGNSLNLSANSVSGASYQWFGPSGFNSSTQNPIINNASSGNSGLYSLIINTSGGCSNSGILTITVNPTPISIINTISSVCQGDSIKLSTTSTNSINWSGPAGLTSNLQNVVIPNSSLTNSGVYYLTTTNTFSCSNTSSVFVTVNALPSLTISVNFTVCSGSAINLTSSSSPQYSWLGPNGFNSNLQNPSINTSNPQNQGYYYLTITDNQNCKNSDSTYVTVNLCTSIKETENQNCDFSVYPSPFKDFIIINNLCAVDEEKLMVKLINSEGKLIINEKYKNLIQLQKLESGIYVIILENAGNLKYSKKIIKTQP
jgi:hypothetical protein